MLLPVILHPDVTDFLRTEFPNNLKDRTWRCIDKLRQQQFDGGLRVKKLRGISKRVWEARITIAIRLIFTYEKSINPDTKKPQIYVAIQDICLDHDDVFQRAKARTKNPDTQWLDLEEIEAIGSLETDCEELSGDEQSAILEAIDEELQILENIVDELLSNIQWQVVESELDWYRAIVEQDVNLPLRLSLEESELVNFYGHLLLSGSAGTGKTTVGLYRLLKSLENLPSGKRLYVAYNPILVKETNKQFEKLVGSKITEIESWFQFKTIRDLCSDLLKVDETYLEYDEIDYQVFERLYSHQPISKKYPPALVWDEIRSIIKGSYLRTDAELLSLEEYEILGKCRSSVIDQNERSIIYRIAQWYQNHLKEKQRFDEIDLARKALKYIRQGQKERYQMIVCDEVQDLTELQLHLLMQLINSDGHLFFAGDLNQMISPSGFRWEDLKTQFYNSEHLSIGNRQIAEKKLRFNFRSVSSLVQLANQLLILRARLLNENINDSNLLGSHPNESAQLNKSARLINAPLENLEPTLKQLYSADAILVRTQQQKEKLRTQFNSSLIFTIEEAKGLEFDTVFLVEFFLHHQDLWQKTIKGIPALRDKEIPQLRLELNLLYVAITRARRILNVWENQLSVIWNQEELIDLVQQITYESVRKERFESTVEMWRERGVYYLDAKRYRQALECFENSGDVKLQWEASAKLYLQEEKYSKAAEFFVKLEDWQQAARLLEKEKQWSQAANCWSKAGNTNKQQLCEIYALESENKWEDAAQRWEKLKSLKEARRCWLKSDNEPKKIETRKTIAKDFESKKQWLNASEQYRLAKMPKNAARCKAKYFETKKQWEKAAEQYELAEISKKVAECKAKDFKTKKQWERAAEQYKLAGIPKEAARCKAKDFEAKKQWEKAAIYWGKLGYIKRQQVCEIYALEKQRKWGDAAQRWEKFKCLRKARECWLKSDNIEKIAEIKAIDFEKTERWEKAAEQYEIAQMPVKAVKCKAKEFETKKQWEKAAEQYELAQMPKKAAKLFEKTQQWEKAAKQYELAQIPEKADDCLGKWGIYLLEHQKYSEAAQVFIKLKNWQQAAQLFEKDKQLIQAALYWGKAGNTDKQQRCEIYVLELANQWEDAAQQWEKLGRLEDAKRCWLNSSNEEKRAEIREIEPAIDKNNFHINNCIDLANRTKLKEVRALCLNSAYMLKQANECPEYDLNEAFSHYVWNKCFWLVYNSGGRVNQDQDYAKDPLEIPELVNEISSCLTEIETGLEKIKAWKQESTSDWKYHSKNAEFKNISRKNADVIKLQDLLLLSAEESFRWMGSTLENRHTLTTFAENINSWYYNGVQKRVSQAVQYKKRGNFDAAFAIYSDLFQEMPTWSALYSSVYKVLASAGRIDEAERAIQLNALLLAFDYTLRKQAMAWDVSFDSHQASVQNGRHGVLAFWAFQDPTLLLHLGAITLLKEGRMDRIARQGYLNSIQGHGSMMGCLADEVLQNKGRKVLMKLPWKEVSNSHTPTSFIENVIKEIRKACY